MLLQSQDQFPWCTKELWGYGGDLLSFRYPHVMPNLVAWVRILPGSITFCTFWKLCRYESEICLMWKQHKWLKSVCRIRIYVFGTQKGQTNFPVRKNEQKVIAPSGIRTHAARFGITCGYLQFNRSPSDVHNSLVEHRNCSWRQLSCWPWFGPWKCHMATLIIV